MSVKNKLICTLAVILIGSFLVTSLVNYAFTKESVRQELLQSSLPLTGKNIYSEIHSDMMRPILVSSSMAQDTFLRSWVENGEEDQVKITSYLKEITRRYGFLTAFFVSAATDRYYYQGGVLKKVNPRDPHDVWYYGFVRTRKEYALDVDTNESENNALTIFINFRVVNARGRLLGVAGVGVNIDHVTNLLAKNRKLYKREIYLVDQDGLVQVHEDKALIEKMYITETPGIRDVAKQILKPYDTPATFEYDTRGEHMLLSTCYIPELKWHLIVEQSQDQALSQARSNLLRTILVGLVASILILVLCTLTINRFQKKVESLVRTDPLTGAANRRALEGAFERSVYKAGRNNTPFSTIIMDLDKFKEINDRYGHIQGDQVLKSVAQTATSIIRPTDLLARWGGDEFIILMDGTLENARALARRVQGAMADLDGDVKVSLTYGLAQYREGDTLEELTRRADKAMYMAKSKGRNTGL